MLAMEESSGTRQGHSRQVGAPRSKPRSLALDVYFTANILRPRGTQRGKQASVRGVALGLERQSQPAM